MMLRLTSCHSTLGRFLGRAELEIKRSSSSRSHWVSKTVSPIGLARFLVIDAQLAKLFWSFEQPPLSVGRLLDRSRGVDQAVDCLCSKLLRPCSAFCRRGPDRFALG